MHYLYFTKVSKDEAKTSEEARKIATEILNNNNFASEGGYFSNAKADWFVVGGRWSGVLTQIQLKGDFYKEVGKLIPHDFGITSKQADENKKEIQAIWEKLGGKNENPYARDSYNNLGHEDDAQIITPELRAILKEKHGKANDFGGQVEMFDNEEQEERCVSDLTKDDDGQWLVVIDYHN